MDYFRCSLLYLFRTLCGCFSIEFRIGCVEFLASSFPDEKLRVLSLFCSFIFLSLLFFVEIFVGFFFVFFFFFFSDFLVFQMGEEKDGNIGSLITRNSGGK